MSLASVHVLLPTLGPEDDHPTAYADSSSPTIYDLLCERHPGVFAADAPTSPGLGYAYEGAEDLIRTHLLDPEATDATPDPQLLDPDSDTHEQEAVPAPDDDSWFPAPIEQTLIMSVPEPIGDMRSRPRASAVEPPRVPAVERELSDRVLAL